MAGDEPPTQVRDAWEAAVAHWDEPARHAALLGIVSKHQSFAWVAARYRERAGDPIADAQLVKLTKAATATLFASAAAPPDREKQPYAATIGVLVVLVVVLVLGLIYTMVIRHNGHNTQAPITGPASPKPAGP